MYFYAVGWLLVFKHLLNSSITFFSGTSSRSTISRNMSFYHGILFCFIIYRNVETENMYIAQPIFVPETHDQGHNLKLTNAILPINCNTVERMDDVIFDSKMQKHKFNFDFNGHLCSSLSNEMRTSEFMILKIPVFKTSPKISISIDVFKSSKESYRKRLWIV